MGYSTSRRTESTLGKLVRELYRFAHEGKYDPAHMITSPVQADEGIRAKDFLLRYGHNRFIVRQDNLPYDPNIRAILLSGTQVLLETSRTDFQRLEEALNEYRVSANITGACVYSNGEKIIQTRTQNATPLAQRPDIAL